MDERDPGVVVQRHLAAFSEGDLERMLSTLAPDASFVSGKTVVEPTDFPEFFGWAMQELVPTIEIENLFVHADQVACQFIESITVDGDRQHLSRAAFFRVADGLITVAKVYDERE